jgi:hypothetical protein
LNADEETAFWAIGCLTVLATQQQEWSKRDACVTAMAEAETRIAHRYFLLACCMAFEEA